MLDDVHGSHGQTGSVHHAGHAAVQGDVVEVEFGGLHLLRIFLSQVPELDHVGMAEQGVRVEIHLGIEGQNVPGRGGHKWVDLNLGTILLPEKGVELGYQLDALLEGISLKLQTKGDLSGLVGPDAQGRIDQDLEDFLRRLLGHLLDIHTPLGRGNDDGLGSRPVHQNGQVVFLFDVGRLVEVNRAHFLTGIAGLLGNEDVAEHSLGLRLGVLRGGHDVDPSLEAILEGSLASSAGMNLGFDHDGLVRRQGGDRLIELLRGLGDRPIGHGHSGVCEELLGLVFVNVHFRKKSCRLTGKCTQSSLLRLHFGPDPQKGPRRGGWGSMEKTEASKQRASKSFLRSRTKGSSQRLRNS